MQTTSALYQELLALPHTEESRLLIAKWEAVTDILEATRRLEVELIGIVRALDVDGVGNHACQPVGLVIQTAPHDPLILRTVRKLRCVFYPFCRRLTPYRTAVLDSFQSRVEQCSIWSNIRVEDIGNNLERR